MFIYVYVNVNEARATLKNFYVPVNKNSIYLENLLLLQSFFMQCFASRFMAGSGREVAQGLIREEEMGNLNLPISLVTYPGTWVFVFL
jgi:hypothetical protein